MDNEKKIVIGCDDKLALSGIIKSISDITLFPHNTISASRTSDLITITNSISPDLIILSFRSNQFVLNDCANFLKQKKTPILCLVNRTEAASLKWNDNIVFTHPCEHIDNSALLGSVIQSIFLHGTYTNSTPETFVPQVPAGNSRTLSRYVMELDQKLELLSQLKNRITGIYPQVTDSVRIELMSIVNSIKTSVTDSKLWDDFKLCYEQTNPDFLLQLAQKHPNLTSKDLKYCCYLKMNMTNNDIRNVLGINQESVRTHKHRLKKKMQLPKDIDIREYLMSIDTLICA